MGWQRPMNRLLVLLGALLFLGALPCCTGTRSVADLERIQNTKGFLTKSLHYAGSSASHHYFEQGVLFDNGWWIPGVKTDHLKSYRVRRHALPMNEAWVFERSSYEGVADPRRAKVRVHSSPAPHVERR